MPTAGAFVCKTIFVKAEMTEMARTQRLRRFF
jgi:hypothetical protein